MMQNKSSYHKDHHHLSFVFCLLTFHIWIFSTKPLGQKNRNFVGSTYGRSSIKDTHFIPILFKHGVARQFLFLVGWFLKIFSSETVWPNKAKCYRKQVLQKISSFHPDWTKNMVTIGNSCFCWMDCNECFRQYVDRFSLSTLFKSS
jgi:hypothetical protein